MLAGNHFKQAAVPRNIEARAGLTRMAKETGIVQDERGQDQSKDKKRAQQSGLKEQQEAAQQQPESPGEPAGGE
ncbi:hypothetical protein [Rhodoplanes sp. Z2-YC6860]|uniref:hypothetical protein n=1 Tax=Rhodoplanes sp. Z2-YC6860 TaxID=674703 RepID=UPI0012EE9438|nr:hypothetical protein [Rhodoplanes sp. Z2-YC6860]